MSSPALVPNMIGMWVYTDERCPRFDPPKLIGEGSRWYINPADVDVFHRWAARKVPIDQESSQLDWLGCTLYSGRRIR